MPSAVAALRPLAAAAGADLYVLRVLLAAADAMQASGARAVQSGRLGEAASRLSMADELYTRLRAPEVLAVSVPAAERTEVERGRAAAHARVLRAKAALAERRGLLREACDAVERARPLTDAPAEVDASLARLRLALGRLDDALTSGLSARDTLQTALAGAENEEVLAWLHLRRGAPSEVVSAADAGLARLGAGTPLPADRALRVRLHRVAALGLETAGDAAAAEARLLAARAVGSTEPVALDLAMLRAERGDLPGARAALDKAPGAEARAALACLSVRGGTFDRALTELGTLVRPSARARLRGAACRAEALRLRETRRGRVWPFKRGSPSWGPSPIPTWSGRSGSFRARWRPTRPRRSRPAAGPSMPGGKRVDSARPPWISAAPAIWPIQAAPSTP